MKGKTPVVSSTGARFGLNMISAVSAQGEFRFMTVKGRVGAVQFIDFIKRLLHGTLRTVFLIVDGHPAHKAKMAARFIETVKDRFQLFLLPPYSPELNPDERVWNDLKNNAIGKQAIITPQQLRTAVINHLRFIQKNQTGFVLITTMKQQSTQLNVCAIMRQLIKPPGVLMEPIFCPTDFI
jgi:transposase